MNRCEICGRPGDKHHIVHKGEGGMDFPLNVIYLCPRHHRGREGPHKNPEVDRAYKHRLQNALKETLSLAFYELKEARRLVGFSRSAERTLQRTLRREKEGYRSEDIIFYLMGGVLLEDESNLIDF